MNDPAGMMVDEAKQREITVKRKTDIINVFEYQKLQREEKRKLAEETRLVCSISL